MAILDENGVVQFEYGDRIQAPETIYDRLERRKRQERRQMRKAASLGERYGLGLPGMAAAQEQRRNMEAALGRPGLSPRSRPGQLGGPGPFPFET